MIQTELLSAEDLQDNTQKEILGCPVLNHIMARTIYRRAS